ncbi:MAG: c-type cytochrome [Gaiella sp.]|nr:c-type cytochrome [Gaiella sp.]
MRGRVLLLLVAGAVSLLLAGCGGDGESDATTSAPPATTAPTTEDAGEGDAANGEQVFASAGCGGCHTFSAAGSTGSVGPNLDDVSPSFDAVVAMVTNGGGAMPSFEDELSEQQIRDVAAFVSGS